MLQSYYLLPDSFLTVSFLKKLSFIWLPQVLVVACGIFDLQYSMQAFSSSLWDPAPWSRIELGPPELGTWSLSHCPTKKVPLSDSWIGYVCSLLLEKKMATHSSVSCLENPRNGGAWWAAVYGVAQSRTRLKRLSSSSSSSSSLLRTFAHAMPLLGMWCSRSS